MKSLSKLLISLALMVSFQSCFAALPHTLAVNDLTLKLNGSGTRSKFFLSLYDAGLYLTTTNKDANSITIADQPMAIMLNITSSMITTEKMKGATLEGFVKSTNNNLAPIQPKVDALLATFDKGIGDGDVYLFTYTPNQGVSVIKNDKLITSIHGLNFKQAFFGIWIGSNPVQSSLKQQLLGN